MSVHYHMLLLVLHEPSLDRSHKPGDFFPPYSIQDGPSHASKHIRDLCRKHAMDLLGCVLAYDDQALREVPIIIYVRVMHSVVVLVKLDVSADRPVAFDIIRRLLQKLKYAAQDGRFLLPRIFSHMLQRLSDWHHSGESDNRRPIQPLLGLDEAQQASGSQCLQRSKSPTSEANTSHAPFEARHGMYDEFDFWDTDMTSMPFLGLLGGAGSFGFIEHGCADPTKSASDEPFESW